MNTQTSKATLTVLLLAGMAQAQVAAPQLARLREAVAIDALGQSVRIGGWDYVANLTAGGMHFEPALGEQVATTQHLKLRPLTYGRRGAQKQILANVPYRDEQLVVCLRGPGVVERHEPTPAGVELSWLFAQPEPGVGDLVVRYAVETSLPRLSNESDGLSLSLPGGGGIRIGTVTGIDANGARVAGGLAFDDGILELRLPESFVESAAYPIVLDPLVGTQFLPTASAQYNDSAADIAYDATNDVYLVAYRRVFSGVSQAVRAQRIGSNGFLVGGFLTIAAAASINHPTVCNINVRNTFVVAWQEAQSLFDDHDIRAVSVYANTGGVSSPVTLAASSFDDIEPDAAGNSGTGDYAMVVYTRAGYGVRMVRVRVTGAAAAPTLLSTVTVTSAASARDATISKSCVGSEARLIAYYETSGLSPQVRARACSATGSLLGTPFAVSTSALFVGAQGKIDVDGNGEDFLVAYEIPEVGASNGERNIYCRALHWSGTTLAASTAITAVDATASRDQRDPAVALCRAKFVVLYADQLLPGTNNYDIRGVELGFDCSACGPAIGPLNGLNSTLQRNVEFAPAIAGAFSGTGAVDDETVYEALIIFSEADDSPPFTSGLVGQRYKAFDPVAVTHGGVACATNGVIDVNGPFAVGNPEFQITLTGADPASLPLIIFGNTGLTPFGCGGCDIIHSFAVFFVPSLGGNAAYDWNVPCSAAPFLGSEFRVQWVTLGGGGSPCALAPDLQFTDYINITLSQ